MAAHNEVGRLGEGVGAAWLIAQGFSIKERNYLKKWGEIDIVARGTGNETHFIEVKTVSYETRYACNWAVAHETWRPEEKVHTAKQARLKRAIQTWLMERTSKGEWQIDILVVRMVPREKYARVSMLENVIFE